MILSQLKRFSRFLRWEVSSVDDTWNVGIHADLSNTISSSSSSEQSHRVPSLARSLIQRAHLQFLASGVATWGLALLPPHAADTCRSLVASCGRDSAVACCNSPTKPASQHSPPPPRWCEEVVVVGLALAKETKGLHVQGRNVLPLLGWLLGDHSNY